MKDNEIFGLLQDTAGLGKGSGKACLCVTGRAAAAI